MAERLRLSEAQESRERSEREMRLRIVRRCQWRNLSGGVAERLNAAVLKTVKGASPSRVRISPPPFIFNGLHHDVIGKQFDGVPGSMPASVLSGMCLKSGSFLRAK